MRPESEKLFLLIQAGNPIISMETPDEPRAVDIVAEVAQTLGRTLLTWTVTEGLCSASHTEEQTLVLPALLLLLAGSREIACVILIILGFVGLIGWYDLRRSGRKLEVEADRE